MTTFENKQLYIRKVIENLLAIRNGNLKEKTDYIGNDAIYCSICGDTNYEIEILKNCTMDNKHLCLDCFRIQQNM